MNSGNSKLEQESPRDPNVNYIDPRETGFDGSKLATGEKASELASDLRPFVTRSLWNQFREMVWDKNKIFGSRVLGLFTLPFKLSLGWVAVLADLDVTTKVNTIGSADFESLNRVSDGNETSYFRSVYSAKNNNTSLIIEIHGTTATHKECLIPEDQCNGSAVWAMQRKNSRTMTSQKNDLRRLVLFGIQKGYKHITLYGLSHGGAISEAVWQDFMRDQTTKNLLKKHKVKLSFIKGNGYERQSDGVAGYLTTAPFHPNFISKQHKKPGRGFLSSLLKGLTKIFQPVPDPLEPYKTKTPLTAPPSFVFDFVYCNEEEKVMPDPFTGAIGQSRDNCTHKNITHVLQASHQPFPQNSTTASQIVNKEQQKFHGLALYSHMQNGLNIVNQWKNLDLTFLITKINDLQQYICDKKWDCAPLGGRYITPAKLEDLPPANYNLTGEYPKNETFHKEKLLPTHVAKQCKVINKLHKVDQALIDFYNCKLAQFNEVQALKPEADPIFSYYAKHVKKDTTNLEALKKSSGYKAWKKKNETLFNELSTTTADEIEKEFQEKRRNLWLNSYLKILQIGQHAAETCDKIGRYQSSNNYYNLFRQDFKGDFDGGEAEATYNQRFLSQPKSAQ